ncbi:MAG: hypothetical protein EA390_14810, partial [Balneolaceae bacterium]
MERKGNHIYELKTEERVEDGDRIELYKVETIILDKDDVKNGIVITWKAKDTDFEIWFPGKRNPLSTPRWCRRFSIKSK